MTARKLASRIVALINASTLSCFIVNPTTGGVAKTNRDGDWSAEDQTEMSLWIDPIKLSAAFVESWINAIWLPHFATENDGGTRDHTEGRGYAVNVLKTSRIIVERIGDQVFLYGVHAAQPRDMGVVNGQPAGERLLED